MSSTLVEADAEKKKWWVIPHHILDTWAGARVAKRLVQGRPLDRPMRSGSSVAPLWYRTRCRWDGSAWPCKSILFCTFYPAWAFFYSDERSLYQDVTRSHLAVCRPRIGAFAVSRAKASNRCDVLENFVLQHSHHSDNRMSSSCLRTERKTTYGRSIHPLH